MELDVTNQKQRKAQKSSAISSASRTPQRARAFDPLLRGGRGIDAETSRTWHQRRPRVQRESGREVLQLRAARPPHGREDLPACATPAGKAPSSKDGDEVDARHDAARERAPQPFPVDGRRRGGPRGTGPPKGTATGSVQMPPRVMVRSRFSISARPSGFPPAGCRGSRAESAKA